MHWAALWIVPWEPSLAHMVLIGSIVSDKSVSTTANSYGSVELNKISQISSDISVCFSIVIRVKICIFYDSVQCQQCISGNTVALKVKRSNVCLKINRRKYIGNGANMYFDFRKGENVHIRKMIQH